MERRLEKLDSEIADLTAKTEAAWDAFISATDPQRKTELKERYIVLNKEKEDCRSERHDLQLKLPSSGKHTACPALCISVFVCTARVIRPCQSVADLDSSSWQWACNAPKLQKSCF